METREHQSTEDRSHHTLNAISILAGSQPISKWRAVGLFSFAGLLAGLATIFLLFIPSPYLVILLPFYGAGIVFAVTLTLAGAIAWKLRWIPLRSSWIRVFLGATITTVAYPLAVNIPFILSAWAENWLVRTPYWFFYVNRLEVHIRNGVLLLSALTASVLFWAAIGIVQRKWKRGVLIWLTALSVAWVAFFLILAKVTESRLPNMMLNRDPWWFWFGCLLAGGEVLFGGICGFVLATGAEPSESSTE